VQEEGGMARRKHKLAARLTLKREEKTARVFFERERKRKRGEIWFLGPARHTRWASYSTRWASSLVYRFDPTTS